MVKGASVGGENEGQTGARTSEQPLGRNLNESGSRAPLSARSHRSAGAWVGKRRSEIDALDGTGRGRSPAPNQTPTSIVAATGKHLRAFSDSANHATGARFLPRPTPTDSGSRLQRGSPSRPRRLKTTLAR